MTVYTVQRRFARYPIQIPVVYKPASPGPIRFGVGWTRELSEGGACLELDERVAPQTPLHIRLQTKRGLVEVEAEVEWAKDSREAGGGVLHGLAFTNLQSQEVQAIRDLLLPFKFVPHAGVRHPVEVPVTCQQKGQSGPPVRGQTGDISRVGLLLLLDETLPVRSSLEVTLHTPQGPIRVEGMVVWVDPPDRRMAERPIRHGLRFNSLAWSKSLAIGLLLAEQA